MYGDGAMLQLISDSFALGRNDHKQASASTAVAGSGRQDFVHQVRCSVVKDRYKVAVGIERQCDRGMT